MSLQPVPRGVLDRYVRVDAVVLDDPLRIKTIDRALRDGDVAAIEQCPFAADTTNTAPGPRSDERAQTELAEIEREDVTIGGREVIHQTYLGPDDQLVRFRVD